MQPPPAPPAPACLQRHPHPSWLPRARTGWLWSNDEGAASCARFWPSGAVARLVALRTATRAALVATALRAGAQSIVRVAPFLMEPATMRALAARTWAALERGGEAAVEAAVREAHLCEACNWDAMDMGELSAAGARLKLLPWCPCGACPAASVHAVVVHAPCGRHTCALAGCAHTTPADEHKLVWATARRLAVSEALTLVGVCLAKVDWADLQAQGGEAVRAQLARMEAAWDRPLDDDPSSPESRCAPGARALQLAPWPPQDAAVSAPHAGRRAAPHDGRHVPAVSGSSDAEPAECSRPGCGAGGKLLLCSTCRAARYCSAACQRAHWGAHKLSCGLTFAAFATAFEAAVRDACPTLRGTRDGEFLIVSLAAAHDAHDAAHDDAAQPRALPPRARVALRNYYETWPGVRDATLRAHVVGAMAALGPALAPARCARGALTAQGDADAPWTVVVRPGSYFRSTEELTPARNVMLPFPELDAAARDPYAGGAALTACLAQHTAFAGHRAAGNASFSLRSAAHLAAPLRARLFVDAVLSLGTERAPALLRAGVHEDAGGVRCTITSLMQGEGEAAATVDDADVAALLAMQLVFSDAAAVARLACPAFCDRLAAALRCAPEQLVAVPQLADVLLVARCDSPAACCALGRCATFECLSPELRARHLSSRPLRLKQRRREDGLAVWTEYEQHGGRMDNARVARGAQDGCPVPSNEEEVAQLQRCIARRAAGRRGGGQAGRGGARRR
jgi:hypothetical protein